MSWRWHSLRGRIARALIGLVVALQLGGLAFLATTGKTTARENVRDEMQVADRVAAQVIAARGEQLQLAAAVLAADFGFRAAMASGDQETIVSALDNSAHRIHADVALLLDLDGHPKASMRPLPAEVVTSLARTARAGGRSTRGIAILELDTVLYHVVRVPVRAPLEIGSVLLGFALDHDVLASMKRITNTEISLAEVDPVRGLHARASTLSGPDIAAAARYWAASTPAAAAGDEIRLPGGDYLTGVTELGSEFGSDRKIILLLNRSLDEAFRPYRQLMWLVTIYTVLVMAAAVLLSVRLASSITAPLRALMDFAQRLARGQYETTPPPEGRDELGDLGRSFRTMRDSIASREQRIRDLAYRDHLTGIPNRTQFNEFTADAIQRAPDARYAVLLLDLDRFKFVNEILGHAIGDRVLCEVGRRLTELREDGILCVARLGGDEYAVLVRIFGADAALELAERVVQLLHVPIVVDEVQIDACASIGAALYPEHGRDAQSLLRCADMAMYYAKDHKGGIRLYDAGLARSNSSSLGLLSELRKAVEEDELVLYFQPKLDLLGTGKLSAEALVRWNHPAHGFVPPMNFIPFAEQTGFIRTITLWVVRAAMDAAADWHRRGLPIQVAINISAHDLMKREIATEFGALLAETRCLAGWILLEVTESALADDPELALRNLEALRAMGCDIAIDDFGTGYSSLSYLERLPVTELKIDKKFVMNMLVSKGDESIVASTIDLAHRLGKRVTAEGIDSLEVLQRLRSFGCDTAQGYYVSRPVPAPVLEAWYREGRHGGPVAQADARSGSPITDAMAATVLVTGGT